MAAPYIVFAQWTVSGFRTVSLNITTREEKNRTAFKITEDCGIEIGTVAINHINVLYIVNISCNMFQLMYKQPSSGWKCTKEKLLYTTYFTLSLYSVEISTHNIIKTYENIEH